MIQITQVVAAVAVIVAIILWVGIIGFHWFEDHDSN